MAGINNEILAEIKERINLIDFIEEHGIVLRRSGSTAKACCPFHKEKTPSFNVNGEKGFYKCFGCGESGDIFSFMEKFEGIPFMEAVKQLAERAGIELKERYDPQAKIRQRLYSINSELAAFYRRCLLQTSEGKVARDYLAQRDLVGEIQERFGLGFAPNRRGVLLEWAKKHNYTPDELVAAGVLAAPKSAGDNYYDRFHGRIIFPICDAQGRVIAFSSRTLESNAKVAKYVNSPETEIFKKSSTLYALHLARSFITKAIPRRAIVCEGQIDVIRCHACGFGNAVASQGTAFTEEHVSLLKRSADSALLIFDGDNAGVKAAIRTTRLFLTKGVPVRIVTLPAKDDPDSLLRTQGAQAFQKCIDEAEDPAPYLVRVLRAAETDPNAMDAVARIAKVLIETVAECPEPVLTAKFLQDGAEALNLPIAPLEHDLEKVRIAMEEATRRRESYQATHPTLPTPPPSRETVASPVLEATALLESEIWMPESSSNEEFVDYADDTVEPSPLPNFSDLEASQNLASALCELLAHYFFDKEVMDCLIRHLPPAFVHNPFAAKLYDLACDAILHSAHTLTPPTEDSAFTQTLAQLSANPDRIISAGDDVTPLIYAHDLVKHYWLREYDRKILQLNPNDRSAYLLTVSRNRLKQLSWEQAEPYMDALNPEIMRQLEMTPLTSQPPPPSAPQPECLTQEVVSQPLPTAPSAPYEIVNNEFNHDPYSVL
ncbi:MAG: DNA primase [Kiritimatiellia bacterium]